MSNLSQLYKFGRLSSQYAIPREQGNTNLIFSNPKKNIVFSGAKPIIKCAEYPILFSLNKQESAKHKCEKMD